MSYDRDELVTMTAAALGGFLACPQRPLDLEDFPSMAVAIARAALDEIDRIAPKARTEPDGLVDVIEEQLSANDAINEFVEKWQTDQSAPSGDMAKVRDGCASSLSPPPVNPADIEISDKIYDAYEIAAPGGKQANSKGLRAAIAQYLSENPQPTPTAPDGYDPDQWEADRTAIAALISALQDKLVRSHLEKGRGGWHDPDQCSLQFLSDQLRHHVDKGDPVDVAAFCAFLIARGAVIQPAPVTATQGTPLDGITPPDGYECAAMDVGGHWRFFPGWPNRPRDRSLLSYVGDGMWKWVNK